MGEQEKRKKQISDIQKGETFYYESAIFKMEWNRIATVVKSFNPEFPVGKTVKFQNIGSVEMVQG